jgi:hypothetical protein
MPSLLVGGQTIDVAHGRSGGNLEGLVEGADLEAVPVQVTPGDPAAHGPEIGSQSELCPDAPNDPPEGSGNLQGFVRVNTPEAVPPAFSVTV